MSDLNWNFSSQIACVLKALRVARGLSQEELAAMLAEELLANSRRWNKAIDKDYIDRVEKGEENLSIVRLGLLCHLLQCKLSKAFKMAEKLADFECKSDATQLRIIIETIDDALDGST